MKQKKALWNHEVVNENFYECFKTKAEELTVKVLRAASSKQAADLILRQIHRLKVQRVASTPLTLVDDKELETNACSAQLDFSLHLHPAEIEQADMGISEFDFGIAQLGCIVQDASDLHTRLVSMLPPIHLALLPTSALVETFAEALEVIEKTYKGNIPPYLSFITGPSKTADIERELTIGVHGPEKLIILCIDP
ncbi:MAG: lactate utilization protein [Candidatus Aminicenantes bacterium]|nr:MAG: lactate utilization protein [Candidatus Aminicenantes bacterium]